MKKKVIYKWLGGVWVIGIPARDLYAADVKKVGAKTIEASKLYKKLSTNKE